MKATNEKVEDISDKGKFDFLGYVKTKLLPFLLTVGVAGSIVYIFNLPK